MKLRTLFIGLLVVAVVSCNSKPAQEKKKDVAPQEVEASKKIIQNFTIANKAAGDFKVGDEIVFPTKNDTYKLEKSVVTKMVEGEEEKETIYTVLENNEKLLNLETVEYLESGIVVEKIGELLVFSAKFKTSEGIGVSSTIDEFIAAYPTYKIWYTYVSDMYVLETESVNAQFLLDKNDFTGELKISSDQEFLKKTDFKSNSKIVGIRIY